jgi:predicted metalloprotease with PDZ domain
LRLRLLCLSLSCISFVLASQAQTLRVRVDLTDAPRNFFHSAVTIQAAPGPITLAYPKWIPGNHRPSGPIANLTGLHFKANGQEVPWERDRIEMYSFHVNVPQGAHEIEATFDITTTDSAGAGGNAASSNLLDLNWNQVVLYPADAASDAVQCVASVHLPSGWKFGTALSVANSSGSDIEFQTVSLTTLVDSPLIAGEHYREVELTPGDASEPRHTIDIVADSDYDLAITPQDLGAYRKLVAEAGELFGARHYREYHFLYTLTSVAGHHGVEHHESSDNSAEERVLVDPNEKMLEASLLPHEFAHSWNGKYRRPAGLATRNYQEPMIGELLWVYEGLTEYLGDVLTARSGLWTLDQYRDALALTISNMEAHVGRTWRPLEDTAVSVQTLRMMGNQWQDWRRGLDYYPEGELLWLDVDTQIRQLTSNRRSIDDFCHIFHGPPSGPPKVASYAFDDVVRTLNQVAPYDWATFLKDRVTKTNTHPPLGGIDRGGWQVVYDDKPNPYQAALESRYKFYDFSQSLGFTLGENGHIVDAAPGSPAFTAGLGPGMSLIAVNTRKYTPEILNAALRSAHESHQPIEVLVENGQFYKTYSIPYFDGVKHAHLMRVDSKPDLLGDILKPRTN